MIYPDIYSYLNVASITDLLDSYGAGKMLIQDDLLPSDFSGNKSINYYVSTSFNGGLEYKTIVWAVNCRAATYGESLTIAEAVYDNLNRLNKEHNALFAFINPTIPPADETDNYNTIVEIRILS